MKTKFVDLKFYKINKYFFFLKKLSFSLKPSYYYWVPIDSFFGMFPDGIFFGVYNFATFELMYLRFLLIYIIIIPNLIMQNLNI